jgi:hypothetical protein
MKGQSFIIEFVLFFLVSFSLFSLISYYFYTQNIFFKERVGNKTLDLVNNVVTTHIVRGLSCRECDDILITEDVPSKISDFFYIVYLEDDKLNTTLASTQPLFSQDSIFNLNETFDLLPSSSTSDNKRVRIKINNERNLIEVE